MVFVLALYVCFVSTIMLFFLGASERDFDYRDRRYIIFLVLCIVISLIVCMLSIILKNFMISAI